MVLFFWSAFSVPSAEIFEQFQSDSAGAFGVELCCDYVFGACACCEGNVCVVCLAYDVGLFGGVWVVAVYEVEFAVVFYAFENGVFSCLFYGVPAHLGYFVEFACWFESFYLAGEQGEAICAVVFFAFVEEELHSDADSEERDAFADDFFYCVCQAGLFEGLHCGFCGSYAGEDDAFCGGYDLWFVCNEDLAADVLECELDACEVSCFVVNYCQQILPLEFI